MLTVATPDSYWPEREYVIGVLLGDFLGLDYRIVAEDRSDVCLTFDGEVEPRRLVVADVFFRTPESDWLRPPSLPSLPLPRTTTGLPEGAGVELPLPILFGAPLANGRYLEDTPDEVRLGIDVFGSAFFLLSRYEEVVLADRDEHDRLPASSSIAFREGFLDRPLVNEYLAILSQLLRRLRPSLAFRPWTYRLRPTHDVDFPRVGWPASARQVLRRAAGDVVRRSEWTLALRRLYAHSRARLGDFDHDPANTFSFLMDASERHGLKSAFYFMSCLERAAVDGNYSLTEPWIRRLLRNIHRRGHEIGFHPSYLTYRDPDLTAKEFACLLAAAEEEAIDQQSWGGRQHYLRWEAPTTWQIWEDAGFDYDATLGFSGEPGFRCGVCHEFRVFNLHTRQALKLREHPLTVMDVTLLHHLELDPDAALERMMRLRTACARFGGEYVLLWHNSELLTPTQRRLYENALEALR